LSVGSPGDTCEREADRVADQVLRMPLSTQPGSLPTASSHVAVRRACTSCRDDEELLRAAPVDNGEQTRPGIDVTDGILALRGRGQPLDPVARSFFEPRFATDLSAVRIHNDANAASLSGAIGARAFTLGNDIAFGRGEYAPDTQSGRGLLAHELTHVLQAAKLPDSGASAGIEPIIRRVPIGGGGVMPPTDPRVHPPGAPGATSCGRPSWCPASFCSPYSSRSFAIEQRTRMLPVLMAGIAVAVNSRVVPLWHAHLLGGSAPRDLTSSFGADFAVSPTTSATVNFLVNALRASLLATPPTFPAGLAATVIPIASRIPAAIAAINTPGDVNEMNFNVPSDIAGNLAGGIGVNQTACRSGARPSPFNDQRLVDGIATVIKDPSGSMLVQPLLNFTVRDTIDLCPGDCGNSAEQIATVPISQFEATGISGDVPFTIRFSPVIAPFTITPASP
jgi:hypothetical protein